MIDDKLTIRFSSMREKKRTLCSRNRRRVTQKSKQRSRHLKKSSSKVRELVAPKLAQRYEIVLLMKRNYENSNKPAKLEDDNIISILRDTIPGKFKIGYETHILELRRLSKKINYINVRVQVTSAIKRIYLKHESDLFAVQIAFQQQIWTVMRIVAAKSTNPIISTK